MKRSISFFTVLIVNSYLLFSQNDNGLKLRLSFEPGVNLMVIPTRSNLDNYTKGEMHFRSFLSPTAGFEGRISGWILFSPVLGYSYFYEESRGWLFIFSQATREYGQNIFLGYKNLKLKVSYSRGERRSAGFFYSSKSISSGNTFLSYSSYSVGKRMMGGIEYSYNSDNSLGIWYLREQYDKLPSDSWNKYSNGFRIDYTRSDKFKLYLEGIVDHPMYGFRSVNVPSSELESLKLKSIYLRLSLSKSISFNTKPLFNNPGNLRTKDGKREKSEILPTLHEQNNQGKNEKDQTIAKDPGNTARRKIFLLYEGSGTAPFGLMAGITGRLGFYASVRTNGSFTKGTYTCDEKSLTNYNGDGYYKFTDIVKRSRLSIEGGITHMFSDNISVYAGAGYGMRHVLWNVIEYSYLNSQETGNYMVDYEKYLHQNYEVEAGVLINIRKIGINLGVNTMELKQFEATGGIGIAF